MRILIVDVNYDYKNIMYRQFNNYLSSCMDIDYFGPGYVPRQTLERGIISFLESREPYDALILGLYFVYSSNNEGLRYDAYTVHRHVLPYYKVNDSYQCCKKLLRELEQISGMIKILNYYEDFVTMPAGDYKFCKNLLEREFYILSWPKQYMQLYSNKTLNKYPLLTNYAYQLAEEYKDCYIPIPIQGISFHEIFLRSYIDREYDWCVPGNRVKSFYPEREKVYKEIEKQKCRIWTEDPYQKLSVDHIEKNRMNWYQFRNKSEKILSGFWGKNSFVSSSPKMTHVAACREMYLESMRNTKNVFTDGGIGQVIVRKYYEACACGALMVSVRIPGLEEMGFIDGENCVILDELNMKNLVKEIKNNPQKSEQIAAAGQKLILEKHMLANRAIALRDTIIEIKKKSYSGAVWSKGNYIILQK